MGPRQEMGPSDHQPPFPPPGEEISGGGQVDLDLALGLEQLVGPEHLQRHAQAIVKVLFMCILECLA